MHALIHWEIMPYYYNSIHPCFLSVNVCWNSYKLVLIIFYCSKIMALNKSVLLGIFAVVFLSLAKESTQLSDTQCIQACSNTIVRQFRETCNMCAANPPITEALCIQACGNTFSRQYREICDQCVRSPPPLTDTLCIHACGNTFSSQYRSLCNRCVLNPPLTPRLCNHACGNTFSSQYRAICNRCQ